MAKKNIPIIVDTMLSSYNPAGTVKQLDSVSLDITVTENGLIKNLENNTFKLFAKKADRTLIEQTSDIDISDVSNGILIINLKNSALQVAGTVKFELEITDSTGTISTATFMLIVEEKIGSKDAIESTSEFDTIEKIKLEEEKRQQAEKEREKIFNELITEGSEVNSSLQETLKEAQNIHIEITEDMKLADPLNTSLIEKIEEGTATNKNLITSIEEAKEFINGLDDSKNIPQLRLDVTKLQNSLKNNQLLEYEGSNIVAENTLESRTEELKVKGVTLLNYARSNTPVLISGGYRVPIDYLGLENGETYSFYVTYLPEGATWSVNNPAIDTAFTSGKLKVKTLIKPFDNKFKSISIKCSGITLEEAKKTKLIVLKGDWSNKEIPEYFEGILNMGEQEKEHDKYKIIFSSSNTHGELVDRKTILIDAPLMGLDNYQDTILEDGGAVKLSKVIDYYSCTGNEEIADTTSTDETSGTNKYKVFKLTPSKTINTIKVLNNLFPTVTFNIDFQRMDGEGLAVTGVGVYIKILKSKLSTQNVDGFKEWLQANRLTIYYALESPIITKIPKLIDIDLNTYNGATTFKIENAIKGTLDFKVPSNLASIVQNNTKEINNLYILINLLVTGLLDTKKGLALLKIINNLN